MFTKASEKASLILLSEIKATFHFRPVSDPTRPEFFYRGQKEGWWHGVMRKGKQNVRQLFKPVFSSA